MNELDKTIDDCLKKAKEYDELAISCRETQDNYVRILGTQYKPDYSTSKECTMSASKNRQLAKWLKELNELRDFANFVAESVMEEDFEENGRFYAEVFCRRLNKLGVIRSESNKWVYDEEVNTDGDSD